MADILITDTGLNRVSERRHEECTNIFEDTSTVCQIYGKTNTCCIVQNGKDVVASIGYVCHTNSHSMYETLSKILSTFEEAHIGDLKKTLVGQYVLLIKKGGSIFLFSDFIGTRNVFYSDDFKAISSSFARAEDILGTISSDLDTYKVLEYLAMRHVLYPAWLGRTTCHRRIKWLLPYEYLVVNAGDGTGRLGSLVYSIDNKKQTDLLISSDGLITRLTAIMDRKEFKDNPVAASLTGGRDSRLVAAIAARQFGDIHFRTAASSNTFSSEKDLDVASKIARIQGVPLDIYRFRPGRDEERFCEMTEGFAPAYNHSITPLIDNASAYSLGFGGVYGTELFMPIPWNSIDEYVNKKIDDAKRSLKVENGFWQQFREAIIDEFERTREHYRLSNKDDRDFIRLFNLLATVRYSSFILSAFNRNGYELEPYGHYPVLELALRVAPELWGNHRSLAGNAFVQKSALAKLNPRVARILTYRTFRPMVPLTIVSYPLYLYGYMLHVLYWLRERMEERSQEPVRTELPGGYYLSDGWEKNFIGRMVKKYGLSVK